MAEKSTRTKMLEEAEIKDDPLMLKRALRGAGVGISKLADKAGFTQEEYKKMEERKRNVLAVQSNPRPPNEPMASLKKVKQKEGWCNHGCSVNWCRDSCRRCRSPWSS
jgi:hypothetical protein